MHGALLKPIIVLSLHAVHALEKVFSPPADDTPHTGLKCIVQTSGLGSGQLVSTSYFVGDDD